MIAEGKIVALWRCPAYDETCSLQHLSGLYELVEGLYAEPGICTSECWVVAPVGKEQFFLVDYLPLIEQADPHHYGQLMREERELAALGEDQ